MSRRAELEDRATEAFAEGCRKRSKDPTARLLAGLTLATLDVTFRLWLEREQDISETAEQVFQTLIGVVSGEVKTAGVRDVQTTGHRR